LAAEESQGLALEVDLDFAVCINSAGCLGDLKGPAGDQRWSLMQLKFYSLFFIAPESFTGLIWNVKNSGVFVIPAFSPQLQHRQTS
jgi:hypothetical protein